MESWKRDAAAFSTCSTFKTARTRTEGKIWLDSSTRSLSAMPSKKTSRETLPLTFLHNSLSKYYYLSINILLMLLLLLQGLRIWELSGGLETVLELAHRAETVPKNLMAILHFLIDVSFEDQWVGQIIRGSRWLQHFRQAFGWLTHWRRQQRTMLTGPSNCLQCDCLALDLFLPRIYLKALWRFQPYDNRESS